MAEGPRMTAAQLADKLLSEEHADVLRDSVAWMARELMEADVSAQIGAEHGERSLERTTHRYGSRDWDTRVGSSWHPQAAPRLLLPQLLGAAPACRAGAGRRGAGGLRQRRVHP